MKLIYNRTASLFSKGITFIQGKEYNVSDEVGSYLLKHFGSAFSVVGETKLDTKPKEPIKEELKGVLKVETKGKPRRRAKITES